VLASDSEPPEMNQLDRLEEVVEEAPSRRLGVRAVVDEGGDLLGSREVIVYWLLCGVVELLSVF